MDKEEYNLKSIMFKQAVTFLEDAEEFFPYGTYINKKKELVPLGLYDEEEYSPSQEMIEVLEGVLLAKIKDNEAIMVAIGIDVLISDVNEKKESIKKNALMIKTSNDGVNWKEDYYPYKIQRNITWE